MIVSDILGTRVILGEPAPPLPSHDNENLELMTGCKLTPAELLQFIRQHKKRLSRAVAADARLWDCPDHRNDWMTTLGIEKLTLWHCYGVWGA
jgi:hypothetical protein